MKSYERRCTVRCTMELSCTDCRCGGICRAKLSRFCTICLVRCASCRITRRSWRALSGNLGIFHQQIGESENRRERIVDFVGDA